MENKKWNLVIDGQIEDTYDDFFDAYDALESHVGGDDFTTAESCDGSKVYGFASESDAAAANGAECSDVPYICEAD